MTYVEINQCVRCTKKSSLSHFLAMTRLFWLGRAVRNRHRHAIEQASRRWRGGRRDDSARTRRKILISTQGDAAVGVVSRSVAYRAGFKISDVRVDAVAPVCPILLVHGSEDTFVGLKHSQKLQQAFKNTATLRVDEGGKHDSRRPDDVLVDCAAFLLDHLVGDAAAVPELRAALTLTRGLGRPPFASSTNFTSGADANRQKAVRATLTRGGAVSC